MKEAILKYQTPLVAGPIVMALGISLALSGWRGGLGMAAGIGASWMHLWLLWRIIGVLGEASRQQPIVRQGTSIMIIGFFVQLPIFAALGFGAGKLGHNALTCFAAGVGMVYFGLVGWGISRT